MKIAVTGGSGFIGARLCKALEAAGHECVVIDIRHAAPVDILDLPALRQAMQGCEAVYHLAAEHRDDVTPRSRYYDVNVKGTANVCAAADANGTARIIFTSSFAVYGLNLNGTDETGRTAPFNDYGQSKLEGEEVLRGWYKDGKILTIVRPTVVFGENNRGNVYNLLSQVASGKFVMVGSGKNKKSMAYVGNVVAFLQFCLNERGSEIYNYVDEPDMSMNDLVSLTCAQLGRARPKISLPFPIGLGAGYTFDLLAMVTGKKFPISAVRVKKFCVDTTGSAEKSRRAGFKPPHTLEEGLSRMIDHEFSKRKAA